MLDFPTQRVVCAANRHRRTGRIVTGARHFDSIMRSQIAVGGHKYSWVDSEQGFIDQRGNFLTREHALEIATIQGQILKRCGGDHRQLFSENLY